MSHQQELFGVDAEDEFEDKCAKLDDGIVPVRLQNTPYQPQVITYGSSGKREWPRTINGWIKTSNRWFLSRVKFNML